MKTILHTKNQINQNTSCLRFKRINQCSECLPYYYLNIFTKKCVKIDSLLVEKVRYNKPQNQYQPFACRSNYFLNLKTKKCVENISNCLTLTKDNKCTLCKPGFSVSHNKTSCLKCPSNCLSCIDSAYFTECVKSHFLTFDRGNQYKHQVTKVNTRNTCKPCVFPCVECLSASFCKVCHLSYERYSKNVTTKLCRITCSMSTEFLENNQCVKCTKCDFCQVRGKVKCVNCPQCKSKCKFMLSEELHIQETSVSYFYVDTHNFILHNTDTLVKVQEKVQITKQTNTRYKVSYNGAATEETVSFFFNPSSVSSVSCVYNFEEPLVLTFTRKTQNIIGLNPENVVSVVYTLKLSALLTQLKANSGYYLIEFLNVNKVVNYLFIFDNKSKNVLKDFNDFSRSNNYSRYNFVQKRFFNLDSKVVHNKFKLIETACSFSMKENLIQAQDVVGLHELLLFGLICLSTLNFYLVYPFFKSVIDYHKFVMTYPSKSEE